MKQEKTGFNIENVKMPPVFLPYVRPGSNVIKLSSMVIYRHSMVIPSFCVIKQHYLGNYCRMAVNYSRNIEFTLG